MSLDYAEILAEFRLKNAADSFRAYSQEALDQLRDSGKSFDETLYQAAIELVLGKLEHKPHDH